MKNNINVFDKFAHLKSIDVTNLETLKALYEKLLLSDLNSIDDFHEFQKQSDEIEKHLVNEFAESHYLMTNNVANEAYKKRKNFYEQDILPISNEYNEKLNKKFLNSKIIHESTFSNEYKILIRNKKNELEIFNKKNIEVQKEIDRISNEITELQAKLMVEWEGEKITLPSISPQLKSSNREIRKKSYEATKKAELNNFEEVDQRFDKLLTLRHQLAKNAGFSSYTKFRFKEMQRFDWDETHCYEFHQAVKDYIVPLKEKLTEKRRSNLKLDTVKPYDLSVDFLEREPLIIYEKGNSNALIDGTEKIIKAIDSELYEYFCDIKKNLLLDLDSRENKAPGGYMVMYPVYEKASVFYNGVGLSHDLMVLLHELGHCFHYYLGKNIFPYSLQNWTSEVAEAGSMSMEYIGLEKMNEYLNHEQCERIRSEKLMSVINLFTMCARGDEFQHWIYSNPGHTSQQRRDKWLELTKIYNPGVDYSGFEDCVSKVDWQFIHILHIPFYFIDYSISEILALTIWDRYKKDNENGINFYKNGCRQGASKTVPEIYEHFGTTLSFGKEILKPLSEKLKAELSL